MLLQKCTRIRDYRTRIIKCSLSSTLRCMIWQMSEVKLESCGENVSDSNVSYSKSSTSVVDDHTRAADCRYPLKMESRTRSKTSVRSYLFRRVGQTVSNDALGRFRILWHPVGDKYILEEENWHTTTLVKWVYSTRRFSLFRRWTWRKWARKYWTTVS